MLGGCRFDEATMTTIPQLYHLRMYSSMPALLAATSSVEPRSVDSSAPFPYPLAATVSPI